MAFGVAITDGVTVAVGTYGSIVRFNILNYEARTVKAVQMQNATPPEVMSAVVAGAETQEALQAYLEDASAPDIAYAKAGDILDVFLLTTAWPIAATNRIGMWFTRNAQNLAATTDKMDIPQEAKTLARALGLREAYLLKGKPVPFQIDEEVRSERARLGV